MNNKEQKAETTTEPAIVGNTMLVAGDLENGSHFQLKKGGKIFTVHCQVLSKYSDKKEFDRMHYTIATDGKKLHVFDYERLVIACH